MNYTLITGASGGIGEALAVKLAAKKHNLILVARNAEKLARLCTNLQETYGVQANYIAADLTKQGTPFQIFDKTQKENWEIHTLVNNAGIGSGGEFAALNLQTELDLMQLNNASLIAMTHLFLQPMRERKGGKIINVASMAAFIPVPFRSFPPGLVALLIMSSQDLPCCLR